MMNLDINGLLFRHVPMHIFQARRRALHRIRRPVRMVEVGAPTLYVRHVALGPLVRRRPTSPSSSEPAKFGLVKLPG